MALKTVRDHAIDTLSLALVMGDKVSEVSVNLSKLPTVSARIFFQTTKEQANIVSINIIK